MPIDLTRREMLLAGSGLVAVPGKENAMASTQTKIRTLLASWSDAVRMNDIDRLMSLYSPDIVYFDSRAASST